MGALTDVNGRNEYHKITVEDVDGIGMSVVRRRIRDGRMKETRCERET